MQYHPIALRLKGRRVLVAGGGKVAERKVRSLRASGACVRVVSPQLSAALARLARDGRIRWRKARVGQRDVRACFLAIAATSDEKINRAVAGWAQCRGILVNVVDRPAISDFISPALVHKRRALIATYTNGRDPRLSRDLKNFLKENWGAFLSYRNGLQKRAP